MVYAAGGPGKLTFLCSSLLCFACCEFISSLPDGDQAPKDYGYLATDKIELRFTRYMPTSNEKTTVDCGFVGWRTQQAVGQFGLCEHRSMINVYSMDNETDIGESLTSNLDRSPNDSSSLSKSDVMAGNQIIDSWLGLSVHCTTSIDDYCDGDLEQPDSDPSPSTSGLSYDLTAFPKTSSAMSMFYPHLSGYDIHPLLLNPRRLHIEPSILDPINLPPHPLMPDIPRQIVHKTKMRTKISHRRPDFINDQSSNCEKSMIVDTDKCQRKTFYCDACNKTFKFQTSLLRHNNKVHISKYQCQSCHRVFSRQAYLDVHTSKQGSSCYLDNGYASGKSKK